MGASQVTEESDGPTAAGTQAEPRPEASALNAAESGGDGESPPTIVIAVGALGMVLAGAWWATRGPVPISASSQAPTRAVAEAPGADPKPEPAEHDAQTTTSEELTTATALRAADQPEGAETVPTPEGVEKPTAREVPAEPLEQAAQPAAKQEPAVRDAPAAYSGRVDESAQSTAEAAEASPREVVRSLRTRPAKIGEPHPFLPTLLADARIAAAYRGERHEFRSKLDGVLQALRLMLQTDAFLGLAAYRLKVRLRALGIPVLPWIAHRLAIVFGQISIADTVVVHPGVLIPHGQVVVYGEVEIHPTAILHPWVTVAPIPGGTVGPTIGWGAQIGIGARVLGEIEVGRDARVGVNAVALDDVPANTTVVGTPARPVTD